MSRDVIITPASGLIDFQNLGNSQAQISLTTGNNLVISNPGGDLSLGDTASNVFIGDGINSVDIIFEQSGAIRALAGKTLTLGQANSFVAVSTSLAVTGNVTSGNISGTTGAFTTITGNGAALTALNMANAGSGTLAVARGGTGVTTSTGTGAVVRSTSPALTTPNLGTPSAATLTNATGLPIVAGTTGTLTVARGGTGVTTSTGTGAVVLGTSPTFTTQISVPSIVKTGTNGVGNIGQSGNAFNTVFAKATSAQYADLAEIYEADSVYEPGTVVIFGGSHEITISTIDHDTRVAGVVSTNPAYIMNSEATGLPVALTGRVPCLVQGPVEKGSVLAAGPEAGVAVKLDNTRYLPGCIIGKALERISTDEIKLIEVVVGRF
jgi:hypothetical protein